VALLIALAGIGPPPLSAQSPTERLALGRFRDSLLDLDTLELRRFQRRLDRQVDQHPDSAGLRLRLGLAGLRLGERHADRDFGDALAALRAAVRRHPDWPAAWYALGLAQAARADWERRDMLALGSRVGTGSLESAAESERRAVESDPEFAPAAVALADLTLRLRDTSRLVPARAALRRAAAAPAGADVFLAWGRIERAAGEPDSALVAFDRYLDHGGDRALGLLELARTRLAGGRADGEQPYYEGAALDDSIAVRGYREDLVPIAADSDLARFDRATGTRRAEFLRRFWSDRDHEELRADGDRLREHYRRLLYARRHFALTVSRRYYGDADAYHSGSEELDDRGAIYVRHGEPAERLRPFVFGLMPNESWRYARADGDLLFHFSAGFDQRGGGDLYDYRLVESVLDLHGAGEAPVDQLLLSRQSLSPVYSRMLNWGPYGAAHSRARERGIGQASIAFGTTTDSYELQFARRLSAVADLVPVGRRGDEPLGHLVFAIAAPGIKGQEWEGGWRSQARIRLVVLDRDDHMVAQLDTTMSFGLSRPLGPGQYLVGRGELPLPAGTWSWRAALDQGEEAGAVLPRDTVTVPRPRSGSITLSGLALGVRAASARWLPDGASDTVYLTPFRLFPEGADLDLYYETAGASPGASYRHEITVERWDPERPDAKRRPVVSLAFDEQARESVVRSWRLLRLARLKPDDYIVEVRVTGADGRSEVRRRGIRMVKRS
jgi:GWxTD domain-containing protein